MMRDFVGSVEANKQVLQSILAKSQNLAYQKVNELAKFTGQRYQIDLQLHFPNPSKLSDISSYGHENVGVVIDKFRKTFPIARELVKQRAVEVLGSDASAHDAYMYEGKEGVRVNLQGGERIEILPGSVHFWCAIDSKVLLLGDWLFDNVYKLG